MKKLILILLLLHGVFYSCNKFLDIVPDNVATLDKAFAMRTMAERYLFTCYSYLPAGFSASQNPAWLAGDEMWLNSTSNYSQAGYPAWYIAMGVQNANSPLCNFWDGNNQGINLWRGIRDCNTFLEHISSVPDMDEFEKKQWAAEVKFLKAYYHYYLLRLYGPVPLIDSNVDIFADPESIAVDRRPIDECIAFIERLLEEAEPDLQDDTAPNAVQDDGRISKLVLYAMTAEMQVTFASPLFNGNTDYPHFLSSDGIPFFNPVPSAQRWEKAVNACRRAVEFAESHGRALYQWTPPANMTTPPQQSTRNQMNLRGAVTTAQNNPELLWVNQRSLAPQSTFTVRSFDPAWVANFTPTGFMAPTRNMAELFYSENGVPIEEDLTYDYAGRFNLRTVPTGTTPYLYDLVPGYTTAGLHFDREDRFYASLAFDGSKYYMASNINDNNAFSINARAGGNAAAGNSPTGHSITGYTAKKLVNYLNTLGANNVYTITSYGFPVMRMANLYLLYAEALNEQEDLAGARAYIDKVRERSGLEGVLTSWENFSSSPQKPASRDGLRQIIQRERAIELAFEGQRFWDIRRWKLAQQTYNNSIYGWDVFQGNAQTYYRSVNLFTRRFLQRDYFWPLSVSQLQRSRLLTQNPGW